MRAKMCSAVCTHAFSSTSSLRFRAAVLASSTNTPASTCDYQTSGRRMSAYSRTCSRYDFAVVSMASSERPPPCRARVMTG